jgi:hypothetical protein
LRGGSRFPSCSTATTERKQPRPQHKHNETNQTTAVVYRRNDTHESSLKMMPSLQHSALGSSSEHSIISKEIHDDSLPSLSLASLQLRGAMVYNMGLPSVDDEGDGSDEDASICLEVCGIDEQQGSIRSVTQDSCTSLCRLDQDYAQLLNATICFRKLSIDGAGPVPVFEIAGDKKSSLSQVSQYFLRVPCRQNDSRIMQPVSRLAQKHDITISQMLFDCSHDRNPDFALLINGSSDQVEPFCQALTTLTFVKAAPTALPCIPREEPIARQA